jgi:multidrug efflux pump subunit AcrA (membrane-fusion protein)
MEARKMEHTIVSPREGVVERVAFKVGDMVRAHAVLFAFVEANRQSQPLARRKLLLCESFSKPKL